MFRRFLLTTNIRALCLVAVNCGPTTLISPALFRQALLPVNSIITQSYSTTNSFRLSFHLPHTSKTLPASILEASMADARYCVEYAKTGRSSCKKCKSQIEKGVSRIGKITANPFSDDGGEMKVWYHTKCMFETLKVSTCNVVIVHCMCFL